VQRSGDEWGAEAYGSGRSATGAVQELGASKHTICACKEKYDRATVAEAQGLR